MSVRIVDNDGCAVFTKCSRDCLRKYNYDKNMCKRQFDEWNLCNKAFVSEKKILK